MPNVPSSTAPSTDNLPQGIDWADGLSGRIGTPSGSAIKVQSYNGASSTSGVQIEEDHDSPTLERAEQATCVHTYRMPYEEALNRINIYGRGTLVTDSTGNIYRVLSSSMKRMGKEGNQASLSITAESLSYDQPPDEFQITPVKLGVDIMKNPRYFYALMPTNQIPNYIGAQDNDIQAQAKQSIIRAIQAYRENPFIPTTNNINGMTGLLHEHIVANISSGKFTVTVKNPNYEVGYAASEPDPVGTVYADNGNLPYPKKVTNANIKNQKNPVFYYTTVDSTSSDPNGKIGLAMAAAKEIIGKLWRMEDSPMLNGWEITWTEYYFRPPPLNGGAYIENPTAAVPPLPDYFYSTAYPPNSSQTIFDDMASQNAQCYSSNGLKSGNTSISWLRDADSVEYQRTWFRVTRKWLGAPIGSWDNDIYSGGERPSSVGDYRNLIIS
tara:strand:+ start:19457 stop:20773 length:1317 start_codon:yes stop_codon:yes gene_type:complete